MSAKSYMNSAEYQKAALSGLDTGIRQLLMTDIMSANAQMDLAEYFTNRADETMKKVHSFFHSHGILHTIRQ